MGRTTLPPHSALGLLLVHLYLVSIVGTYVAKSLFKYFPEPTQQALSSRARGMWRAELGCGGGEVPAMRLLWLMRLIVYVLNGLTLLW